MPRGLSLHSLDLTASARVPGAEVVSFGVFHPLDRARITAGNDRDGTSAEGPPLATTACSRTSRIRRRSSGRERAADLPFGTSLCARDLPSRSTARPSAMVSSCSTRQTTCDLDAACFPASLRDPVTCSCFCPVGRPGATNCTGHPPRHCIRKTARPVLPSPPVRVGDARAVEAPPSGLRMTARNSIQRRRIYSSENLRVNATNIFFLRSSIMEVPSRGYPRRHDNECHTSRAPHGQARSQMDVRARSSWRSAVLVTFSLRGSAVVA